MKVTGITVEYNPFHNGHKLHIEQTKSYSATENIFAVMSGNFVQRGEPAIFNKYFRTKCALLNGVGIVIELPCVFATSSAEFFASAAIKMFDDSNICSSVVFGAENDDINIFKDNAKLISDENEMFKNILSKFLDKGMSYPSARENTLKELGTDINFISSPNNILALEYVKALTRLNSKIEPIAIKRVGNDYNQTQSSGKLSSATSIRKNIFQNKIEDIINSVPPETYYGILNEIENGRLPISINNLSDILNYRLRILSVKDITKYHGISEGLENRIISSLNSNFYVNNIVSAVKSKRYTYTRIQRAMLHICLDITNDDIMRYKKNGFSPYIRVLGFRKDKEYMLKELVKNSKIPVITNIKNASKILDDYGMEILNKEITADNIYTMLYENKKYSYPNQDFTTPLVIV